MKPFYHTVLIYLHYATLFRAMELADPSRDRFQPYVK